MHRLLLSDKIENLVDDDWGPASGQAYNSSREETLS
jgi:hypothetical protein